MLHKPWDLTQRLVDRMADSSLLDGLDAGLLKRPPRSEGLHASELLRRLHPHPAETARALMSEEDAAADEAQLRIYGMLGLAFEDRCEIALQSLAKQRDWPWLCSRPGEVKADGIAMSPDILLVGKPGLRFEGEAKELSIKVTWKSCRGLPVEKEGEDEFPEKFNYYIDQCRTYATALGTTGTVLVCYFMCGNWRPPVPKVYGWDFDFSEQEMAETWDAIQTLRLE